VDYDGMRALVMSLDITFNEGKMPRHNRLVYVEVTNGCET